MKKAVKAGEEEVRHVGWTMVVHDDTRTKCKHGVGTCEACGTNDRTDKKHTTIGGRGTVARLREKK